MKKTVALILTFALLMVPSFAADQAENEPVNVIESELASAGNGARALTKPVMVSPIENEEFPYDESIKLDWVAPADIAVSYYRVRIRRFNYNDSTKSFIAENDLMIDTIVNAQTTEYDVSYAHLGAKCKYRYAIAAVTASGSEYWTEGYFYTGDHNGVGRAPISFHIGNYFSEQTKNQIYYACQKWNNELYLGYEVVNTYPFTQGTDLTTQSNDGISCITGAYVGTSKPVMVEYTYVDDKGKCRESDIVINRSHPWANSAQEGKYDIQSVVTREIGHTIGLAEKYDSNMSDWTMFYVAKTNSISGRTPEDDEIYSALNFCDAKVARIIYDSSCAYSETQLKTYYNSATAGIYDEFGIDFRLVDVSYSTLLNGTSCPNTTNASYCTEACGSNENCKTDHHKGSGRLLKISVSDSYYTCRVVGHRMCCYDDNNPRHFEAAGLGNVNGMNTIVTTYWASMGMDNLIQHELTHNLGGSHTSCDLNSQPCVLKGDANVWCDTCRTNIIRNN